MVWLHHEKAVHLHHKGVHLSPLGFAACQSKKCTNKARVHQPSKKCTHKGVHLSQVHQPIKKYTNQRMAPTALLVQLRQLHPLKCTNQAKSAPT